MGLHPFNRDKALRKLRFRQHRGQYIKIGTIILSIIIFVAGIIYYSYSKYTVTNKFDVIQTTVGEFSKCKLYTRNQTFTFDYTGAEQTFTPACDGYYKLETWGAQGGSINTSSYGGYGGYSVGIMDLTTSEKIYLNVGGQGKSVLNNQICSSTINNSTGGYNGGGLVGCIDGNSYGLDTYSTGGGGATSISNKSGLLSTLKNSIDSIYIISGGGGGVTNYNGTQIGGNAGGYIGVGINYISNSCSYASYGGTQSAGGKETNNSNCVTHTNNALAGNGDFGIGGTGSSSYLFGGGGGSGYYGGSGSTVYGAGGGSSYINNSLLVSSSTLTKHMTCYNCTTSTDSGTYTISNTCTNATATTDCSKTGNGYAKITYLGSTLD